VVGRKAGKAVRDAIPAGPVKDALSGVALGHALHPLLTDTVIGTWTSATLLDVLGGRRSAPAAERLIALGIAFSLPTTATGLSDWADTEVADDEVRRVGVVYGASLAARRSDRRGLGILLGLAGAGLLGASGHLGGHLAFAKGVGVDQTAWGASVEDWTDAAAEADVPEGGLVHAEVAGAAVVLVRRDGRVHALADRCTHRGGPLHGGSLVDGCIECPLHGSRFRLDDGSVERGPAAYPQQVYDVRTREGRVQIRTPPAAHQG
jgi:nitrite reductase/ring-hydroxylating ferredoxin subunit